MPIWKEDQTDVLDRVLPDVPAAPRKVRDGGPLSLENVRVIPSFLERLRHTAEEGWDLRDPEIARVLPASEAAAFSIAHRVEIEDAMDYLSRVRDYTLLIQGGWIDRVWMWCHGFRRRGEGALSPGFPIPIAELHSPAHPGCRSSYSVGQSSKESLSLLVSARGSKTGGGIAAEVSTTNELTVAEGCVQITVPGDIHVVPWENEKTGEAILEVKIDNLGNSWSAHDIPSWRPHFCACNFPSVMGSLIEHERLGWVRRDEDYVLHELDVSAQTDITKKWQRKQTGRFCLSIGGLIDVESEFTSEFAYSYTLRSRNDYVGYFEDRLSEVRFWSWKLSAAVRGAGVS